MKRKNIQLMLVVIFSAFFLTTYGFILFEAITKNENLTTLKLIFLGLSAVSYFSLVCHGLMTRD